MLVVVSYEVVLEFFYFIVPTTIFSTTMTTSKMSLQPISIQMQKKRPAQISIWGKKKWFCKR